jgi:cation transport ATPase
MSRQGGTHDSSPSEPGQGSRPRIDPKYSRLLLPAVMAAAMSLVMSLVMPLVDTMVRFGLAPNLASAWLSSFVVGVVGVVVAAPTAILIAPAAQRLVGQLTGGQRTDR